MCDWFVWFVLEVGIDVNMWFVVCECVVSGVLVVELFCYGCLLVMLLLWLISFMNLIDLYFLLNWLLIVMCDVGYLLGIVVIVGMVL